MRVARGVLIGCAVILAGSAPLAAGKKVKLASSSGQLECCTVFVQQVIRPAKKISVVSDTRLQTMGTMVTTVRDQQTLDTPAPPKADRFVGITVTLSATEELRSLPPNEWEKARPTDLAPIAELVFPDGVTVRAVTGAGFDGLKSHVDAIAWGPGTIMTNEAREVVFRNYVWQPKDLFVGTETLYFPVSQEHWKRVKPEKLRLDQTELTFTLKKW